MRLKKNYRKVRLNAGRDAYINEVTNQEVSASEALDGHVAESRRVDLNESTGERLKEGFKALGMSKKQAKLAAKQTKSGKDGLVESFKAMGLSKREAKLAARGR